MIRIYGTSHVSEESYQVIENALAEHDPEVVALELDYPRLNSLLSDERDSGGGLFPRLIRYFQRKVGEKTGMMPGKEMEYAYHRAVEDGRDIALVDQDIRVTLSQLKKVRRKEKVKAGFSIIAGLLGFGEKLDIETIPEDEMIDDLVKELQEEFPGIYRVLMEERNNHIVEALKQVDEENEGDVVAFLGAAHVKRVEEMLDEVDNQGAVEEN